MDDSIFQSSLRLDQIPEKNPDVEDILKRLLKREVSKYMKHFHGKKCELCPFRVFKRTISLRAHLEYHKEENMYLADIRSPQLNVIRALFDYRRSVSCLQPLAAECPDLLHKSAYLINMWNASCTGTTIRELEKKNRPILVRVLTKNGPEYWAKELTIKTYRLSRELYYTPQFADLMLSFMLTHQARTISIVNALYTHIGSSSITPGLLPKNNHV